MCSCAAILLKKGDGKCGKDELVRSGRIIVCPVDDERTYLNRMAFATSREHLLTCLLTLLTVL